METHGRAIPGRAQPIGRATRGATKHGLATRGGPTSGRVIRGETTRGRATLGGETRGVPMRGEVTRGAINRGRGPVGKAHFGASS